MYFRLGYKFYKKPEECTETNNELQCTVGGNRYTIKLDTNNAILKIYSADSDKCECYDLQKHVGSKFKITGITLGHTYCSDVNNVVIIYHCHRYEETDINYGFAWHSIKIRISSYYEYIYKFINWIWNNIIDNICILPSYTELDAMPVGWRNSFGMQMCKDIRRSLLYTYVDPLPKDAPFMHTLLCYWKGIKLLYSYRIEQIKEKYGTLRWYDYNSTRDVEDIILKYEDISAKTCIECGKPATKMSTGWICPYCDEHAPVNSKPIESI